MNNNINPVKRAINQFYSLMRDYSEYGAEDSEPRWFFNHLLGKAFRGEDFPDVEPGDWQLYSTMDVENEVANELTAKARQLYDLIMEAKHHDVVEAAEWFGIEI